MKMSHLASNGTPISSNSRKRSCEDLAYAPRSTLTDFRALNIIRRPRSSASMEILASKIQRELDHPEAAQCAVYEDELQRIWALNVKDRKSRIEQFAKEHGFRLAYYREELAS